MPFKELKAFKRVSVETGRINSVLLSIPVFDLQKWDQVTNSWKLYKGNYSLTLGQISVKTFLVESFTIQ